MVAHDSELMIGDHALLFNYHLNSSLPCEVCCGQRVKNVYNEATRYVNCFCNVPKRLRSVIHFGGLHVACPSPDHHLDVCGGARSDVMQPTVCELFLGSCRVRRQGAGKSGRGPCKVQVKYAHGPLRTLASVWAALEFLEPCRGSSSGF